VVGYATSSMRAVARILNCHLVFFFVFFFRLFGVFICYCVFFFVFCLIFCVLVVMFFQVLILFIFFFWFFLSVFCFSYFFFVFFCYFFLRRLGHLVQASGLEGSRAALWIAAVEQVTDRPAHQAGRIADAVRALCESLMARHVDVVATSGQRTTRCP